MPFLVSRALYMYLIVLNLNFEIGGKRTLQHAVGAFHLNGIVGVYLHLYFIWDSYG